MIKAASGIREQIENLFGPGKVRLTELDPKDRACLFATSMALAGNRLSGKRAWVEAAVVRFLVSAG
jgi:hypothetical protein